MTLEDREEAGRVLHKSGLFAGLGADEFQTILDNLSFRTLTAGEFLVRQGEYGSKCFIVLEGGVDVVDEQRNATIATLGAGTLVGETALLTGRPRNATVRAQTALRVGVLTADMFASVLATSETVRKRVHELWRVRERPKARSGIEVHERTTPDGHHAAVLKDAQRSAYFRLSEEGLVIWQCLDGHTTIREIATALYAKTGQLAPERVLSTVTRLRAAGFLAGNETETEAQAATSFLDTARRILTARTQLHNVDPFFAALFPYVRWLFTRAGAAAVAIVVFAGLAAFVVQSPHAATLLESGTNFAWFAAFLLPIYFVSVSLHECAHGLAVKAIGRTVAGAGVGWYWFGPIAFVDASDAWLGTRRERLLVSAAGPIANLLLASLAVAVGAFAPHPLLQLACWQFALTSYLTVLENLNPLLELDGYYMLIDIVDVPALRAHSLRWLGLEFPQMVRRRRLPSITSIEAWYGVLAIGYFLFAAVQSAIVFRIVGQRQLAHWFNPSIAELCAWLVPTAVLLASIAGFLGEIRNAMRQSA